MKLGLRLRQPRGNPMTQNLAAVRPAHGLPRRTRLLVIAAVAAVAAGTVTGVTLLSAPDARADVIPGTWYTVVNKDSGKCVDARAAATANGTAVQQYACNGTTAQQWQFTATSGGYFRVGNRNDANQVWDVTDVSTADNAADPAVALRRRQQPAVAAGAGGRRRVPLRQPQQRQVPGRPRARRPPTACSSSSTPATAPRPSRSSSTRSAAPPVDQPVPPSPGTPDLGPERRRSSTRRCRPRPSRAS